LTEAGIPVFHDAVTCFDSLAAHYADARPFGLPADQAADTTPGVALLLDGEAPGSVLSEWQSSALLREAGVPMVPSAVAHDMAQALEEATRMGFPVVLKAMVPGIAHKHQAGLVGIGLHDATALEAEFARQQGRIAALGAANHAFWLLQPMLRGKLELIAGVTHEPGLGHFLVFGIGGVHTEIWDQIDLIPVPVAQGDLGACVAASRTSRLLNALEPSGAARQSLVDTLASLQTLVQRHGSLIGSIDVNPLLLSGTSLVAVDALVVMSGRA
jgi:acetyl-CoA synthetase (ADP-forming)